MGSKFWCNRDFSSHKFFRKHVIRIGVCECFVSVRVCTCVYCMCHAAPSVLNLSWNSFLWKGKSVPLWIANRRTQTTRGPFACVLRASWGTSLPKQANLSPRWPALGWGGECSGFSILQSEVIGFLCKFECLLHHAALNSDLHVAPLCCWANKRATIFGKDEDVVVTFVVLGWLQRGDRGHFYFPFEMDFNLWIHLCFR